MKCPECGDTEQQQRLPVDDPGSLGYRCGHCARLYTVPITAPQLDLIALIGHLGELRDKVAELGREQERLQERLQEQIVAAEEQAQSARDHVDAAQRRLRDGRR